MLAVPSGGSRALANAVLRPGIHHDDRTSPRIDAAPGRCALLVGAGSLVGLLVTGLLVVGASAGRPSTLSPPTHSRIFPDWLAGPLHGLWSPPLTNAGLGVGFTVAICAMYVFYVLAFVCAPRLPRWWTIAAIVLAHLIFFISPPLQLTDVFNYLNYGRMEIVHGLNPYATIPALEPHSDPAFAISNWHHLLSPYGPLFTFFTFALVPLGVAASFWVFKASLMLVSLASLWLVWRCARLLHRDPLKATLLVGLNPLVLVWGLGGDHNDFFMMLFVMLAVYLLLSSRSRGFTGALTVRRELVGHDGWWPGRRSKRPSSPGSTLGSTPGSARGWKRGPKRPARGRAGSASGGRRLRAGGMWRPSDAIVELLSRVPAPRLGRLALARGGPVRGVGQGAVGAVGSPSVGVASLQPVPVGLVGGPHAPAPEPWPAGSAADGTGWGPVGGAVGGSLAGAAAGAVGGSLAGAPAGAVGGSLAGAPAGASAGASAGRPAVRRLDGRLSELAIGREEVLQFGCGLALVCALAIKLPAAILMPIVLVVSSHRRWLIAGMAGGGVVIAIASYVAFGVHLPDLGTQSDLVTDVGLPNLLGYGLGLGGETVALRAVLTVVLLVGVGLAAQWASRRRGDWIAPAGVAVFGLLVTLSWQAPWYVLWILPFAALTRRGHLRVATLVFGVYLIVAFVPAIDIAPPTSPLQHAQARDIDHLVH
jgi:hypothetical protein